jgi:hypothetical protein
MQIICLILYEITIGYHRAYLYQHKKMVLNFNNFLCHCERSEAIHVVAIIKKLIASATLRSRQAYSVPRDYWDYYKSFDL